MKKELTEMTLEELWALFPISLVQPQGRQDRWKQDFAEMERFLQQVLRAYPVKRISHIGSTAIHGIWAKDIVDVLVEFAAQAELEAAARALEQNGLIRMATGVDRISLNKGYTPNGFADRVYHVHLRYEGDNDELYFRDYLNEYPEIAKAYAQLKLTLWKKYTHDRDAYTAAKSAFIAKWTKEARERYGDRYCMGIEEEKVMLFLHYPKCSTCQKAKKWLDEHQIAYAERHIVEEHPTAEELKAWHAKSGLPLKRFFNTSGLLYKEMHLKDKLPTMNDEEMLTLLATNGMLVKRPLLVADDKVLVGFKEAEWAEKLNG